MFLSRSCTVNWFYARNYFLLKVVSTSIGTYSECVRFECIHPEVAIAFAVPAPVKVEIVFAVVSVAHKSVSTLAVFVRCRVENRTPGIEFGLYHGYPLRCRIVLSLFVGNARVVAKVVYQCAGNGLRVGTSLSAGHERHVNAECCQAAQGGNHIILGFIGVVQL